jgi:hypothetical protein
MQPERERVGRVSEYDDYQADLVSSLWERLELERSAERERKSCRQRQQAEAGMGDIRLGGEGDDEVDRMLEAARYGLLVSQYVMQNIHLGIHLGIMH